MSDYVVVFRRLRRSIFLVDKPSFYPAIIGGGAVALAFCPAGFCSLWCRDGWCEGLP